MTASWLKGLPCPSHYLLGSGCPALSSLRSLYVLLIYVAKWSGSLWSPMMGGEDRMFVSFKNK